MSAEFDELTGLNTAEQFKDLVERYLSNSSVAKPYSLVILDIVKFKKVNVRLGHRFGDNVLVQVADIIIESMNPGDIAGRLGGDEFVIFFKNVGENATIRMCDRIRKRMNNIYVGEGHIVDASMGVATSTDPKIEYLELIKTADAALTSLCEEEIVSGVKVLGTDHGDNHEKEAKHNFSAIFGKDYKRVLSSKEKRLIDIILELFEQAKDIEKALVAVLSIVAERRHVSAICVNTYTDEGLEMSHVWTSRGIKTPKKLDGKVIRKFINENSGKFLEDGMGIINPKTVSYLPEHEQKALLPEDAKSVIFSEIKEFGENVGVITFVDCNNSEREWTEKDYKAFKSITRLIGAFTLKAKAIKLS